MGSRAVREDQKARRRETILATARNAFQAQDFAAVRMSEIARAAGLAKGTVYLYFDSKEALFLAIVERELTAWFDDVDAALGAAPAAAGDDAVVTIAGDALAARPLLAQLLAILHTALEHNIDYDTAFRFKTWLRRRCLRTGALLERALPQLAPGDGILLILRMHALVIGFQHAAHPAPVVAQVLKRPGMNLFRVELIPAFKSTLRPLLAGWTRRGGDAHGQ